MTTSPGPDLTELRRLLRESKAISARSQDQLDDPEGADLIKQAQHYLEVGLGTGRADIAEKAAATLANLHAKEAEVRRTQGVLSEAEDNAVRVIRDVSDRFGQERGT